MKNIRKGLGKGLGTGYKNLAPMDSHIHSLSAKGVKTTYCVKDNYGVVWKKNLSKSKADKLAKDMSLNAKSMKDVLPSERYKVGKQIESWDESDIIDEEVKYKLEAWEDFGYEKKPTESEVRDNIDEYGDVINFAWDNMIENLTEIMEKKNPNNKWRAEVKNFGWRSSSGENVFYAEKGDELLSEILPKTDNTFKIFNFGKGFAIQNFHHDSPTGNEWYYIVPISDTEYEELQ